MTDDLTLYHPPPDERPGVTSFRTLMMDPPWDESGGGVIPRGANRHYPLVKTKHLPGVIHGSGLFEPANHAHLWMWATNNFLSDAIWLGRTLGFEYKTNVVWVKTADPATVATFDVNISRWVTRLDDLKVQMGIGQYLRGSHELLLFFTRGKGQHPSVWNDHRDVPSVIRARRGKHSAKPFESYRLVERVSKGPRVEFFARSNRDGWTSWGNDESLSEGE